MADQNVTPGAASKQASAVLRDRIRVWSRSALKNAGLLGWARGLRRGGRRASGWLPNPSDWRQSIASCRSTTDVAAIAHQGVTIGKAVIATSLRQLRAGSLDLAVRPSARCVDFGD